MSKEKKFQLRNQKILSTAENILKEKGYYRFKISDISEELDIAKGTIYNHYPSKEELLFTIIYPKFQHLRDALQKIPLSNLPFKKQLQQAVQIALKSDYHQFLKLTYSDIAVLFQEKNQKEMISIQEETIQAFKEIQATSKNFFVDFVENLKNKVNDLITTKRQDSNREPSRTKTEVRQGKAR